MANPEHVAILRRAFDDGIEIWNRWRQSQGTSRPDLSHADLSGKNLDGANLFGANLRGVNLFRANLRGTDFSRANLQEANVREANLRKADLRAANLYRADFHNSNMPETDLSRAKVQEADLSRANLSVAILREASLISSNLREANLSAANLSNSDLSETDLSETNLFSTNLTQATLDNANFNQAICMMTVFGDVDLSDAKNLHLIHHEAPSTVGIDTLYKSGGNIPEIFMRGCGIPDTMITFAKSLVGKPIDYFSCFISYSTADEVFARLLYDTLQGRGIRCWFAPEQILPGERLDSAIDYGIRYWDKVLFCASKSSLTEKWWVDFEVDKAFKKARDLQRQRGLPVDVIIPLNLDGYLFSPEYDSNPKRSIFEMTLAADFVGWQNDISKFNKEVDKVIRALRTDGGKEEPPPSKL